MKKLIYLFLGFFILSTAAKAQTIAELAAGNPNFSTLNAALQASGLDETLDGEGPFTLFAPTNAAFAQLHPNLVNAMLTDPTGVLTDVLLYHVVEGVFNAEDLSDDQELTTVLGQVITISINGSNAFVNQAGLQVTNVAASNGVVHVINSVLGPQTTDVFDIVAESDIHNTLEAALIAAELDAPGVLSAPSFPFFASNYTLFAPTDAAFDALPPGALDALLADPFGELSNVLFNHVAIGNVLSTNLSDGQIVNTLGLDSWEVNITPDGIFIGNAEIIVTDLIGINGVVHVIDAVLANQPPPTVFEIVEESENHNTLEAALIAAELDGTLNAEGTFTLFAPTDAAFNALPANLVNALLTDPTGVLTDILLYHVIGSTAFSGDLNNGDQIPTLFGQNVQISLSGDNVFVNGNQVVIADLEASNGVVHVIDVVLGPQTTDVFDIVAESDIHTTLETALIAADLNAPGVLVAPSGNPFFASNYTLFAPTDAAFDALPEGTVDALLADPLGQLSAVLFNHIVTGNVLSTDLTDGQLVNTLGFDDWEVEITPDGIFIGNAEIIVTDLVGINGIVHVVDAVLAPLPSIFEIVEGSDVHNTLEAALIAAELDGTLAGDGDFTLFAPTDAAFEALPDNFVNALLTDPSGVLSDILLYHVVGASAFSGDLNNGDMIGTLFGQDVEITIDQGNVFVNGALVSVADIEAVNGVVHVIDAVLVPETTTILDVVSNDADFSTLATALTAANLASTFGEPGAFTVFAPTNAAFDALPAGVLDGLLADPEGELTNVLLYHVVDGIALSTDLADGQMIETLLGQNVMVSITVDGIFINDAEVSIADIVTVNGVIHVIDAVLTPEPELPSIFEIVASSEVHNTLEAALLAAELDGTLSSEGSLTLFAPTDAAFEALPANLVNALLTDPSGVLSDILLYHVVGSAALSGSLNNGDLIATLLEQDVTISIVEGEIFVNDALVITADLLASNGVVHVIDAVLIPETTTILDVVAGDADFSTLATALTAAELAATFGEPGAYTVFAPTNTAFDNLPAGLLDALLADPTGDLASILLYHVVDGIALSTDLSNGQQVPTLFGETVEVGINGAMVTINDAMVTIFDIVTINGVIHVIDAVLVPTTLSTSDADLFSNFEVYPNPTNDLATLNLEAPQSGRLVLNVINMVGQVVRSVDFGWTSSGVQRYVFDVSDLPAGYYLINLDYNGKQASKKLIVTK